MIRKPTLGMVLLALAAGASARAHTPRTGPSWDFSHGDLKVAENKRFLVHTDGTPFFYLGDTAWELFHRLDRREVEQYLEDRRGKGFTVIQAVCLAELDGLNTPNALGRRPLIENDPTRPDVTPGADPADAVQYDYWDHVDYVVETARAKGIYIGMLPTWGDHVLRGPLNAANARAYGKFLGGRYARQPNIIWILGGDRPPAGYEAVWRELAAGLKEGDHGKHLMTYHPRGNSSSGDSLHAEPWLDFNMWQTGHAANVDVYNRIARDYARTPVKPVLDGEPLYEDHPIGFNSANGYATAYDVRKHAYWDLFAGACGHTYGCHNIWQMHASGRVPKTAAHTYWYNSLDFTGAWNMLYLRNLMLSRPVLVRVPDQSLLASDAGEGGQHVQATRAADGSYAMIYVPMGKPVTVKMDKLSGPIVKAWWFDPRNGTAQAAGECPNQGAREFKPPLAGLGNDWVLVLDDASNRFPAPGTAAASQNGKLAP